MKIKEEIQHKYSHLFSPIQVRNIIYRNRICSTPMGTVPVHLTISSTDYGGVSIYDKALGGCAMVGMCYHGSQLQKTFETNGGNPFDKYEMDVLREELSVSKAAGALVGMDIGFPWHYKGELYTPSGRPFAGRPAKKITNEVIMAQLDILEEKAGQVKTFGFDSLILDISNDNIIAQFMAPCFNDRRDEWGGSLENRLRIPVEAVKRARKAVGNDFVIELRVSAELMVEDSYTFEELCDFVGIVKDEIDILNIMVGMDEYHEGNIKMCPMIFEPHMGNKKYAKKIRELYPDLLINLCTGIMTPEEGEYIIREGIADFIMCGRSLNADPYWPIKAQEERTEDIVPCIRCNQCYNTATKHFNTACSVNPRHRRENRVPLILTKNNKPKKVVIIGGGPAGLKAALTAEERGHDVILVEKDSEVGGLLNVADKGKYKADLHRYNTYLKAQLAKSHIRVILNKTADREYIKSLEPDAIIIAIGSEPKVPRVEIEEGACVMQIIDYIALKPETGSNIIIVGGGATGCEVALELSDRGKNVTIIEFGDCLAPKGNVLYRAALMKHVSAARNLTYYLKTACQRIMKEGVEIETEEGRKNISADMILLSVGQNPKTDETASFFGIIPATYYVGDCKNVASVMEATNEAYFIAASL